MDMIRLSAFDLGLAASLVAALAASNWYTGAGHWRTLIVAAVRCAAQLLLIGLVLEALFANVSLWWVALLSMAMLIIAGYEVMWRQQRRFEGLVGYALGTLSMFVSSFSVTFLALTVIVGPDPWYEPRYAIPLLGMMLGNTMTGVALTLDNLTRLAWQQRAIIEARLMLGHDWSVAIADIRRDSVRNGLIPIVNAMAAAGVVSLPGMMTGQILAGNPPMEAVKYQILVFFLVTAGTGFGILAAAGIGARRLFDERQRLRLDRLRRPMLEAFL
ncbi:MAG: ABC transporter permease [Gammaproteobacteria bacterium]|nr:ABC transporter permease [Gammaproteobacteria bacterium]